MSGFVQVCKALAIVVSFIVSLSPLPSIRRMGKAQSTGELSVLPLVSLGGNSSVWIQYAVLVNNFFPLFIAHVFRLLMSLYYVAVYYRWTTERAYVRKVVAIFVLGLVVITTYMVLGVMGVASQSTDQVTIVIGFFAAGSDIIATASPFETVRKIVRMKSAASLPIALCATRFINSSLWAIVGIANNDMFILIPDAIGAALGATQIILYIIYNPNRVPHQPKDLVVDNNDISQAKVELTIDVATSCDHLESTEHSIVYEAMRSPSAPGA